jgi:hypothetical protein
MPAGMPAVLHWVEWRSDAHVPHVQKYVLHCIAPVEGGSSRAGDRNALTLVPAKQG